MKIERVSGRSSIDVKRLHIPYRVEADCPTCGKTHLWDGGNSYLSFPVLGKPIELHFYCYVCDLEWKRNVKFDISLEAVS